MFWILCRLKKLRPPLASMSPFYPSTCSCSGLPILLDDYAKSLMLLRKLLGCSMMFVVVSASFDFKVKWKSKKFSSIIQLLKIKSIFHLYRPANLSHQFNLYKPSFSIKAHFLIWSYEACNNNDKLVIENLVLGTKCIGPKFSAEVFHYGNGVFGNVSLSDGQY